MLEVIVRSNILPSPDIPHEVVVTDRRKPIVCSSALDDEELIAVMRDSTQ